MNQSFSHTTGSHAKANHAASPLITTTHKTLHEVPKGSELKNMQAPKGTEMKPTHEKKIQTTGRNWSNKQLKAYSLGPDIINYMIFLIIKTGRVGGGQAVAKGNKKSPDFNQNVFCFIPLLPIYNPVFPSSF